jgi:type II secretory pathway pseudopilin PulG
MGSKFHPGFTIIETMLFLAITGTLIVAILAGSGAAINNQRYQDSVTSLKTLIQDQYAQVTSVNNAEATDAVSCDTNGVVRVDPSLPAVPRGQGGCVIMGRFMLIDDMTVTTSSVVGYNANDSSVYLDDLSELRAYNLSLLATTTSSESIQWSSKIAWPVRGPQARIPAPVSRSVGILILRSPKSGVTYTYTANAPSTSALRTMISTTNQAENRICMNPNGVTVVGGLAVVVVANATGPTGIEVRSNDMGDVAAC